MHVIHHIGQRERVHPPGLVKPDAHNGKDVDGGEDEVCEALEGSDEHGETGGHRVGSHGAALEPCVGRGVPDPGKGIAVVVRGAENNEEFEELV